MFGIATVLKQTTRLPRRLDIHEPVLHEADDLAEILGWVNGHIYLV